MNQTFQFEERMIFDVIRMHDLDPKVLASRGAMLAGGTVNSIFSNRTIKDLDFYCHTKEQTEELVRDIAIAGFRIAYESDNAVTFNRTTKKGRQEIQVIKRFVGTPKEILDTFDFTIVQGLFDFATNSFVLGERFLLDLGKRQLVFTNSSRYPICALYRTKKYQERGYTLSGSTMVAISMAIHSLKIETYADLKDQLMGIDTMIFRKVSEHFDTNMKFELSQFMQLWTEISFGLVGDGECDDE